MDGLEVDNWDDEFDELDNLQFRSASTATSLISHPQANHRDSISSRMSLRSDSNPGDEHWDVPFDEQSSVKDALTIARSKGIPLPSNLPKSALEGGTIRKLGGKVVKKAIADDWSDDLDFGNGPGQLQLAKTEDRDLSESLRQLSAAFRSSPKSPDEKVFVDSLKSPKSRLAPTPVSLDKFRDADNNDDFGDVPTIRVAKHRSPQKPQMKTISLSEFEDGMDAFDLPQSDLRLSTKQMNPTTPHPADDIDFELAEGSLGTRHAGLRRGAPSGRSSTISAMSPTPSSAFSLPSDDGLDGLVLPQGQVNFQERLKKKQEAEKENLAPPAISSPVLQQKPSVTQQDDWAVDFEFPQGKVYDAQRLTLNRNIKKHPQRATSPPKIKATSVAFTNPKTVQLPRSRLGHGHERQERPRSHLEPVSETGAPIQRYQRPNSRLGHGTSSSVSNIPAPSTPTLSTPSRRDLRAPASRTEIRYQAATTTSSQLLQSKRSMPVMAGLNSSFTSRYARPSSRQDNMTNRIRPQSPDRPESRLSAERKGSTPFLPAGVSTSQSQHISLKSSSKNPRRTDSDGSVENMSAAQRSLSRLAARPSTPGKSKADYSSFDLAAMAKKTIARPLGRRRNWGDGSELEAIDDLPTSAAVEAKFTKQPVAKGLRSQRTKLGSHNPAATSSTSLVSVSRNGAETPVQTPSTPLSPPRNQFLPAHHPHSKLPSYLRDTAASRNARAERSISSTFHNLRGEPLMPPSPAKSNIPTKPTYGSIRRKKSVQQKPHLIRPMSNESDKPKEEKGMYYDPEKRLWLGNNDAVAEFDGIDVPDFVPHEPSPSDSRHPNVKGGFSSPAPTPGKSKVALIMNIGGSSGVQLVNGMVFDPRQMKWLKVAHGEKGDGIRSGAGSVQLEEEEDVFAGLEDLKEESERQSSVHDHRERDRSVSGIQDKQESDPFTVDEDEINHASGSGDDLGLAEEYDVGPEFVRRQRTEEDRWKRKVDKWLRNEDEVAAEEIEGPGGWRWAIRDLVIDQAPTERLEQGALMAMA